MEARRGSRSAGQRACAPPSSPASKLASPESPFVTVTAIHLRASRNRRSSFGDQVIELFEFYEAEDPEYLFHEGCLWCNLCSGKEEGVEANLQEFQDFDEFED
uniref:Uncharacterized protein n=1 Tax=Zea mays TaxID=4577 RepID=B6TI15_MAIZE|nr:hypothetical protein [Zea mays]